MSFGDAFRVRLWEWDILCVLFTLLVLIVAFEEYIAFTILKRIFLNIWQIPTPAPTENPTPEPSPLPSPVRASCAVHMCRCQSTWDYSCRLVVRLLWPHASLFWEPLPRYDLLLNVFNKIFLFFEYVVCRCVSKYTHTLIHNTNIVGSYPFSSSNAISNTGAHVASIAGEKEANIELSIRLDHMSSERALANNFNKWVIVCWFPRHIHWPTPFPY
jgi:hypothetical protein